LESIDFRIGAKNIKRLRGLLEHARNCSVLSGTSQEVKDIEKELHELYEREE
jgi:hypothetical protein